MTFAVLQILISLCAATSYAFKRDWWHAGYWLAAAAITICVTRMK